MMLMRLHTGGTHTSDTGQMKWVYFRYKDILTNTTNLILPVLMLAESTFLKHLGGAVICMSSLPQAAVFFIGGFYICRADF